MCHLTDDVVRQAEGAIKFPIPVLVFVVWLYGTLMGDPAYFTTAYFHRPEELASECAAAGLVHETTLAVEGPGWLLPDLDARLADERRGAVLLAALAAPAAKGSGRRTAHARHRGPLCR